MITSTARRVQCSFHTPRAVATYTLLDSPLMILLCRTINSPFLCIRHKVSLRQLACGMSRPSLLPPVPEPGSRTIDVALSDQRRFGYTVLHVLRIPSCLLL